MPTAPKTPQLTIKEQARAHRKEMQRTGYANLHAPKPPAAVGAGEHPSGKWHVSVEGHKTLPRYVVRGEAIDAPLTSVCREKVSPLIADCGTDERLANRMMREHNAHDKLVEALRSAKEMLEEAYRLFPASSTGAKGFWLDRYERKQEAITAALAGAGA